MTFDVLGDMNWLAAIVGGIAYFALGAVWFTPATFGKAWQRAMGWEMPSGGSPGPAFYIGPLITCLLAAIAVGMLAQATGSDTFGEGIVLGLVTGVGIAGAVLFVTGVFDPKKAEPVTWFGITAGYHLVGLLIASVIVSLWT
jgi:uncharacterized protein DUF1761